MTFQPPSIDLGLPGPPGATRVVVAMSGGVDSSVVAGMLSRAGYEVVGITLQLYDHGAAAGRKGACCAGQDVHDARRVAETLGIAHYVLDYEERFRTAVIERFADAYVEGETPLPCADCNSRVKFTDLLQTARDLGAQALATGHYVASRPVAGGRGLFQARETARDQSYFLYGTTAEQLDFLRFPLGGLTKPQTRQLAHDFGLGVAEKLDSQDICFVPSGRYTDIVARLRPEANREGDIVHLDGRPLGRHPGITHFTVGQRRGLKIATGEPLFVVRLERAANRVVVGPREALMARSMRLRAVNWIGDGVLSAGREVSAFVKVRSARTPVAAALRVTAEGVLVTLHEPEEGVSPGQACVFYDAADGEARLLGGGTIASTEPAHAPASQTLLEASALFEELVP